MDELPSTHRDTQNTLIPARCLCPGVGPPEEKTGLYRPWPEVKETRSPTPGSQRRRHYYCASSLLGMASSMKEIYLSFSEKDAVPHNCPAK